ncbi:MAG: MFS transporter [Bacteroidia bacterium]|nr:MFS transporter [Bacteroidia bacterium]
MKKPELLDFAQERIRVLHFTWIAFFISFYIWFNMAPLATTMLREIGWLTPEHLKILAICNVALTIPARILIGVLIDRYGPRVVFSGLLVLMAIPTFIFAFGDSFLQLLVARLVLGSVGASFVIGIRMVSQWFPPMMIGRAEGFYAGWGNFGSAWAAVTLPWLALTLMGEWFGMTEGGWRWALFINGVVALVYGVLYYFLVRDTPKGVVFVGAKKMQPMEVSSYGDLVQYLVWSFPLVGALGLLAWRIHVIELPGADNSGATLLSAEYLYMIFAILVVIYVMHVLKTLQVNIPILRRGVPEAERYPFSSVAALNMTYIANFGAELAVVSMLPAFFESTFLLGAESAGLIASSFAFVNLVARPLGGLISDKMHNRKLVMSLYMLGITGGFATMGLITGAWPIWLAVAVTVLCSFFVQGAEGATFAIIPLIKKNMTGQIAGMAGAYGNVGAVLYLVIFSYVDASSFFFILAAGAAVSFLSCLVLLKEPKGSFDAHLDGAVEVSPAGAVTIAPLDGLAAMPAASETSVAHGEHGGNA